MNQISLQTIYEESMFDISFTSYWQVLKSEQCTINDIRKVWFEKFKPKYHIFGREQDKLLLKTYDKKFCAQIFNMQDDKNTLSDLLGNMTSMFDCYLNMVTKELENVDKPQWLVDAEKEENDEESVESCIDKRNYFDTLMATDFDYNYYRSQEEAEIYYVKKKIERNMKNNKLKVDGFEIEILMKYPQEFI